MYCTHQMYTVPRYRYVGGSVEGTPQQSVLSDSLIHANIEQLSHLSVCMHACVYLCQIKRNLCTTCI